MNFPHFGRRLFTVELVRLGVGPSGRAGGDVLGDSVLERYASLSSVVGAEGAARTGSGSSAGMADRPPIRRARESAASALIPTPAIAYTKERGRRTSAFGVISPDRASVFAKGIGVVVMVMPASDNEVAL